MDIAQFAPELVTAAVAAIVALLLQRKIVSKPKLTETLVYAEWAVKAAEEAYRLLPKSGGEKLTYARKALQDKFGITDDEAEMLIHAAVKGLKTVGLLESKAPAE